MDMCIYTKKQLVKTKILFQILYNNKVWRKSLEKIKKANVDEKDMKFIIQVNTQCVVDKTFSQQIHKVRVSDQVSSIIKPLEKLYQCNFKVISTTQKQLKQYKSFRANNIGDGQTLQLFGIPYINQIDEKPIRFFQRFTDFKKDSSWPVESLMEGIVLTSKVDVLILGVGIFESFDQPPGPFGIDIAIKLTNRDGKLLSEPFISKESGLYKKSDVNEMHYFLHKFKRFRHGIILKVGCLMHYIQKISFKNSYYSESGLKYKEIKNPDMDIFSIYSHRHSKKTSKQQGIIPGFIYQLC
ncbi:UNKNOWN [Stylonychia lemnae]|uniref:PHR domain-containing protein n=1 Tax=Stylonychia lemnae TaxID=5949 RepID=A0A078AB71_STYLE|nr:UNKNOWN [Stylonychia lemnae]|eukprot:CDW79399.1 UNKNOWN [Stylonychia lemnae]